MTRDALPTAADGIEVITFEIGEQSFCVDVRQVREIRGWTPETPIPHAPVFLRGVTNLRGAILPIVDAATRLGLASAPPSARSVIVVIENGERLAGLLVDDVSDIIVVSPSDFHPTPDIASAPGACAYVDGLLCLDGRMVSRIAINEVLPTTLETSIAA